MEQLVEEDCGVKTVNTQSAEHMYSRQCAGSHKTSLTGSN